MNEIQEMIALYRGFAKRNLSDCAKELIEWQDTGLLRDGKVRELAGMCAKLTGGEDSPLTDQLNFAQRLIEREALEQVSTA